MRASSYKGATRIDYSFYTWITEEGVRNKTATNIMAREWLVAYKSNLVTQCADGTMNDILEDHAWTAEYTANSTLTATVIVRARVAAAPCDRGRHDLDEPRHDSKGHDDVFPEIQLEFIKCGCL